MSKTAIEVSDSNQQVGAIRSSAAALCNSVAAWVCSVTDGKSIRAFEISFVGAFMLLVTYNMVEWRDWLTLEGFHLSREDSIRLGYPPAMPPLLPGQVLPFIAATFISALCVLHVKSRRVGLCFLFLIAIYLQAVDYLASSSQNRICIAIFGLLAFGPAVKMSDGKYIVARALPLVLKATIILIYFDAGFTKVANGGTWLRYDDCLKLAVAGFHRTELAAWLLRILPDSGWSFLQYCVVTFELGAPVWMVWRKSLPYALAFGVLLHLSIALLMINIGFLSLQMLCFYLLFLPDRFYAGSFIPQKLASLAQSCCR